MERFENLEEFVSLIDQVYDEICIWDSEHRLVYINHACCRHYGLRPEEFIGKKLSDLCMQDKLWFPTVVIDTVEMKKPVIQRQKTILGQDITTISVPVFDSADNVKYIIQSVRDSYSLLYRELSPIPQFTAPSADESGLICRSPQMRRLAQYCRKIAPTDASILILGETGVGKSHLARYIHAQSGRRDKPFVTLNMASLNPNVIESELFGYVEGAFTGAARGGKKGVFEMAQGGTLFLDEIGDLPGALQVKLLNVLQDGELTPVGGVTPVKLDVRIICATNCVLKKMIEAGRFREDLYHRINLFELVVPPLRERREDMKLLSARFLQESSQKYRKSVRFSDEVLDAFAAYLWPGNVRELANIVERGVVLSDHGVMSVQELPESFFSLDNAEPQRGEKGPPAPEPELVDYKTAMDACERDLVRRAYRKHPSSRRLAEALNVSQATANRLIQKHIRGSK